MGDNNKLRAIWRSTDSSYIKAVEGVENTFAAHTDDKKKNPYLEDSDSDSRSTSSTISELYAAIPNEFRPRRTTTSFPKAFNTNNDEQRTKKFERRVNIKCYNNKKTDDKLVSNDEVVKRETKNITTEEHLALGQHLEKKKYCATTTINKTIPLNFPAKSPDNRQFSTGNNAPGVKYRSEKAKSFIPVEPLSTSKAHSNIPEERYELMNNDNCTKFQMYKESEKFKANTSKEYLSVKSCGTSKLFVDCEPEDDSGFSKPSSSTQREFHRKVVSETQVELPSGNDYKGDKNNRTRKDDPVNFNNNKSSENNLSKICKKPFSLSNKEESITYNVVPKQIECDGQKQSSDKTGLKTLSPREMSPVKTIGHKCYVNNCCYCQTVKEAHLFENTITNPDRNTNSDSVKNKTYFQNKQSFTQNRSFNCRSNNYNVSYNRNRRRRIKKKGENTFQNSQSNSSKRYEHNSNASYSNKTGDKNNNNSRNTNLNNASHRSRSRKSQDPLYSIRSSDYPSTSSNTSSDDDDDDVSKQPIQYHHILTVDSTNDQCDKSSATTEEKVTYGEKIKHHTESCCPQNGKSSIGIVERDQETVKISETKTYVRGRLLHKVTRINYKEVKTNAREFPEMISKNTRSTSARPTTEDGPRKNPTEFQPMKCKHTAQTTKWDSNLTFSKKRNQTFFPRKPSYDKVYKSSRGSKSTEGDSSQFRSVNETASKVSQNQTEAVPQIVSEVQETDTCLFSYVARKTKGNMKDDALPRSQSKCQENARNSAEDCYGFQDKFIKKIVESQNGCNFEEFKSVINGVRRKNTNNFSQQKCDGINEIFDKNKQKQNPQKSSNNLKMAVENHSLSPKNNLEKFNELSDTRNVKKEEPVKDIAQTHALKSEICLKETHKLTACEGEGLIIESEILTKRNTLMHYGKEISNFILGSHFAVEELLSLYTEWIGKRQNTLQLLRTLSKNVTDLKNIPGKGNEILKQIKLGAEVVSAVPVPYVHFIGRLISVVASIVSTVLLPSNSKPSGLNVDELGITLSLQQDLEVSSELYRHCLLCDQQFQNTREFIEEFYSVIVNENYKSLIETSPFLKEITGLNPGSCTYYKRLKKAIEKTIEARLKSELEMSYCQLFVDFDSSLKVVDNLDWRFSAEGFNLDSLENRWDELSLMMLSYDSLTFDDIVSKIQNSVKIFGSEELVVKRTLARFQ